MTRDGVRVWKSCSCGWKGLRGESEVAGELEIVRREGRLGAKGDVGGVELVTDFAEIVASRCAQKGNKK